MAAIEKKFIVDTEDAGKRLDVFLTSALKNEYSRSAIKQAIEKALALVNGKAQKPSYKLRRYDEILFTPPKPKICEAIAEDIPLKIIYEDEDIVVVNKPAGMVVHPASGNYSGTLVNALLFHCKGNLANLGGPLRPGAVHRLDKEVSGIIVLAKTDAAYKELIKQFKERKITRKYIALVKGRPALKSGEIVLPIGRSSRDRKKMAVKFSAQGAKHAITYYKVLKQFKDCAKLMINLGTGRTHQIRVHTSYIGHPILGDVRYGGPRMQRVMLHALSLQFKHPIKGNDLYFETPLPIEFKRLEELG